jgi:hypothetical protein
MTIEDELHKAEDAKQTAFISGCLDTIEKDIGYFQKIDVAFRDQWKNENFNPLDYKKAIKQCRAILTLPWNTPKKNIFKRCFFIDGWPYDEGLRLLRDRYDEMESFQKKQYHQIIRNALCFSNHWTPKPDRSKYDPSKDRLGPKHVCKNCGKHVHTHYKNNKRIPDRKDVCQCSMGIKLREEMAQVISDYRKSLKDRKAKEKRDYERYKVNTKNTGKKPMSFKKWRSARDGN